VQQSFHTPGGVRLRLRCRRPGRLNWLFLPGGPGLGSESLHELADRIEVPGACWMVDLPGDGSNRTPPGVGADPFAAWPGVLLEAARALPDAVYAGHSTGGMYLLATPALEAHVVGLALLSSAPDSSWHPRYVAMTERHPLPEVEAAARAYEADPTDARLCDLAVASAPWNFTAAGLAEGRALLARMPYNGPAVVWSDRHFDHSYRAAWWPAALPTLVLGGAEDRIVDQSLWNEPRFLGPAVLHRTVPGAGHFPWIDNPAPVAAAFGALAERILARLA
jgi:pimeloyl-ACP methyl ester carboxylesterase